MEGETLKAGRLERVQRVQHVGLDRVEVRGETLLVRAAREMPDWRASEFRRTAVHYQGSRYAVMEHREEAPGRHVYRLQYWPDELGNRPGHELEYDEAYVDARERRRRAASASELLAFVAKPLVPVIGLLPSGVKARWHGVIGVHPNTATRASIFLEYLVAMVFAVLALIHLVTGASVLTAGLVPGFWLAPLALLDAAMRSNRVQDPASRQYGCCEWLFPAARGTRRRCR